MKIGPLVTTFCHLVLGGPTIMPHRELNCILESYGLFIIPIVDLCQLLELSVLRPYSNIELVRELN